LAFSLRSALCSPLSPLALEPLRDSRPEVGAGIAAPAACVFFLM
jgi:hypothetical protein